MKASLICFFQDDPSHSGLVCLCSWSDASLLCQGMDDFLVAHWQGSNPLPVDVDKFSQNHAEYFFLVGRFLNHLVNASLGHPVLERRVFVHREHGKVRSPKFSSFVEAVCHWTLFGFCVPERDCLACSFVQFRYFKNGFQPWYSGHLVVHDDNCGDFFSFLHVLNVLGAAFERFVTAAHKLALLNES